MPRLFEPLKVGTMQLQHRAGCAPLTRFRSSAEGVHGEMNAEYYSQRASYPGTLVITEATFISPAAGGYPNVPGVFNEAQTAGWKVCVDAVHAKKSFLVCQLWALGRAAVPAVLAATGHVQVSASEISLLPDVIPHALDEAEIAQYVIDYAKAAKNFISAGGDAVEVHSANGYLLDQFLQKNSNVRTDSYGGSVENRCRFPLQVLASVVGAVGQEKTGIRLSPYSSFQGMKMSPADIEETFSYYVKQIKSLYPNLAYLHVVEGRIDGNVDTAELESESLDFLRKIWGSSPFLVAGSFKGENAIAGAEKYDNTVYIFGRYFISNPDLVQRVKEGVELASYERDLFYSSGPVGYTDYPRATVDAFA